MFGPELNNYVPRDLHDQIVAEKERTINLLEYQNELMPHVPDEEKIKLNEQRKYEGNTKA